MGIKSDLLKSVVSKKKAAKTEYEKAHAIAQRNADITENSFKQDSIFGTIDKQKRGFDDDYKTHAGQAGSRLEYDMEGRPLYESAIIAGRRNADMEDVAITAEESAEIAKGRLGIGIAPHSKTSLRGDLGRAITSQTGTGKKRDILFDKSLIPKKQDMVINHELAHHIDNISGDIKTDGLNDELGVIYNDLNNPSIDARKKVNPGAFGYTGNDVDREYIAEAVRAYIENPNYIKSVAPKTAARIREYVNSNEQLKRIIQFNAIGAGVTAGALYTPEENQAQAADSVIDIEGQVIDPAKESPLSELSGYAQDAANMIGYIPSGGLLTTSDIIGGVAKAGAAATGNLDAYNENLAPYVESAGETKSGLGKAVEGVIGYGVEKASPYVAEAAAPIVSNVQGQWQRIEDTPGDANLFGFMEELKRKADTKLFQSQAQIDAFNAKRNARRTRKLNQ